MCEAYLFQFNVQDKVPSTFEALNQSLILDLPSLSTSKLLEGVHKYAIVPQPPKTSKSFNSKLYISEEIKSDLNHDDYFRYVIYNIFDLIDTTIGAKFVYRVHVKYKMADEVLGWRQAHILVKLYNADFDTALVLWKTVGDNIEDFFNILKKSSKNIWPANKVDDLIDLISIEFDSSD